MYMVGKYYMHKKYLFANGQAKVLRHQVDRIEIIFFYAFQSFERSPLITINSLHSCVNEGKKD